jgi:hypothetical protein
MTTTETYCVLRIAYCVLRDVCRVPGAGCRVTRHSSLVTCHGSWFLVLGSWFSVLVSRWSLASALLLALAACGAAPGEQTPQADAAGGSRFGPESVAENFFKDLRDALKDPALADDAGRSKWAEKLANYFAPNERDEQRVAMNAALSSFADGLKQLEAEQTLTLDLRFTNVEKISDDGERALVRPVNGAGNASIYLLIAHVNDRGLVVPEFEQEIGFEKITGRSDGAVPTIKIGDRWYLTEG